MQELLLVRLVRTANARPLFDIDDIDQAIFLADRVAVMTARPGQIAPTDAGEAAAAAPC